MNSLEDTHTMDSYAIKKRGATSFDLEGCPWVLMNHNIKMQRNVYNWTPNVYVGEWLYNRVAR